MKGDLLFLDLLLGVGGAIGLAMPAIAQLNLIEDTAGDRALGTIIQRDVIPGIDVITDGSRPQNGQNLFHSFQEFNVQAGRGVYFANPAGVQNIFSRVTGTDRSDILGTLGIFGTANLYFINPNGIIFGVNSALDLQGSFIATTANAIQLGNMGLFSASNPASSNLLTIEPSALSFSSQQPQSIVNHAIKGFSFLQNQPAKGLQVTQGQNLLLVGGDVQMEGGILQAPGGRVELGGLSAAGMVGLERTASELRLQFLDGVARSDVSLINSPLGSSEISVTANDGGNIAIHARNLDILGGSLLRAGIEAGLGTPTSQAGNIALDATRAVQVEGIGGVFNSVRVGATGNAGNIIINAGSLKVTNGALLSSITRGQGNAGNVSIIVRDAATFDGVGSDGVPSGAESTVDSNAVGKGGTLTLNTGSLKVTNGAELSAGTSGKGDAGNVSITVRDAATFDGMASNGAFSFAGSQVASNAVGKGGTLTLTVGSLTVTNGAVLSASTFGKGDAGNVSITVRDAATFDGSSGVASSVDSNAVGKGGTLTLTVGSLTVTNGAVLSANTFGQGDAGDVSITVRDAATLDGVGSDGASSFAGSVVASNAVGKSGTLTLNTGSLKVTNGAQLSANTFGKGDAGDVSITVRDTATLDGVGSNGGSSAIASQVRSTAVGKSGTLILNTGSLTVTNGAKLSASTFGKGDAGNVSITVRDAATFYGSSGVASSVDSNAVGKGGTLTLTVGSLTVTNGAQLSANTDGQGDAGNVSITVRDQAIFQGRSTNGEFPSAVFSSVEKTGTGKGGNVEINTGSLKVLDGAHLVASTNGQGDAGNIVIVARNQVLIDGTNPTNRRSSAIYINNGTPNGSISTGAAGNLSLKALHLILSNGAVIDSRTFNDKASGDITLNLEQLTLLSGGQISINSSSSGSAGKITITATDKVHISGTAPTYADRFDQAVTVPAPISTNSGLYVRSTSTGPAGEIRLTTPNLTLDQQGRIDAQSAAVSGGNIFLTIPNFLLLRNSSQISATAGTTNPQAPGNGGDIDINARFIIAIPKENSDITANATQGRGGNVNINSQGIFGLKLQPKLTPFSDITASSEVGLTGNIILSTPDNSAIPKNLSQLSSDNIDTNQLLAQTCLIRQDQPQGTFYVTGTGGIPNRPSDLALSTYPTNTLQPTTQTTKRPWKLGDPIVEPQGFYKLANGRLIMSRECASDD